MASGSRPLVLFVFFFVFQFLVFVFVVFILVEVFVIFIERVGVAGWLEFRGVKAGDLQIGATLFASHRIPFVEFFFIQVDYP
jgi:hypothetical protein